VVGLYKRNNREYVAVYVDIEYHRTCLVLCRCPVFGHCTTSGKKRTIWIERYYTEKYKGYTLDLWLCLCLDTVYPRRFLNALERIGFPGWLHGTIDMERDEAWLVYIEDTVANRLQFMFTLNIIALVWYCAGVLFLSTELPEARRGQSGLSAINFIRQNTKIIIFTYGCVFALTLYILAYMREQPFAKDITDGGR